MDVKIENKKIYIDNKIIELPFTPFKFIKFDEVVVVMMNEMGDKCRDIVVPF